MAGKPGASGIKGGSIMTPAVVARVIEALRDGDSRTGACAFAQVSRTTLDAWIARKPENREAVEKAEADRKREALAVIRKAAGTTWQAAAWYLERKFPDEFGQRARVDLTTVRDEAGLLASKIGIEDTAGLVERADELARGLL